ncbi:hypothetical protein M8C21_011914, partial [Ambrosia artemisiifolia]
PPYPPFTVSPPSTTLTQFSNPILTFPYTHNNPNSLSQTLSQFNKPKLNIFTATATSPSVSTEPETVDQDEKFDWLSQWYAIMPVCDLDKRAPHGKRVLGLDVVVWWDRNESAWKVFNDMCPHRLAPLSEGRIDQWGRLQCVYHGWCFSGSGECKLIPQAPPDGPPVHTFPKACVAVYPSIVQNGIVWFWPSTDPQYKDIVTKKKPPYIPELDDPSFTYRVFSRDIPYGYEVLIENLMDPAHVDREGGRPLDLNVQQIDRNGFTAIQPYGRSQFVAPCLYCSYFGSSVPSAGSSDKSTKGKVTQKPARRTLLIFICMPVSPGNSRVMMISPRNYNVWMDRLLPRWMFHIGQNLVIDSDLYLLHVEEKKILEAGPSKWQNLCYVPTKSDGHVVAFRKWLKIYAGGQIDWGNKFNGSLPPTPPREQLMDRYWSH